MSPFLALPFVLKLLELPLRVCSGRDFVSADGVTKGVTMGGGSTLVPVGVWETPMGRISGVSFTFSLLRRGGVGILYQIVTGQ